MMNIFVAYLLDLFFGSPNWIPHPVRGIGWLITKLEDLLRKKMKNLKAAGIMLAVIVTAIAYLGVRLILWDAGLLHPFLRQTAAVIMIYLALSTKELGQQAVKVRQLVKTGGLAKARTQLSALVGRDTNQLDSEEIIRATVESVAENTVDGIIAVLFYAFIGGPHLAWVYKAVNTLDSMVGYRNHRYEQFGWFSARMDDVMNFIPARISAFIIPIASAISRKDFLNSIKTVITDRAKHPSPNSGIPEAAFAGALSVQLGGLSYYQGLPDYKPHIGRPKNKLKSRHIDEAVSLMYATSAIMIFAMLIIHYIWMVF